MYGCSSVDDLYGITQFVQSGYVGSNVALPDMEVNGSSVVDPRGSAYYTFRGSRQLKIVGGQVLVSRPTISLGALYRLEGASDLFITGGHQLHLNSNIATIPSVVSLDTTGNQRLYIDGWYVDCRGMSNSNSKSFFVNTGLGSPQYYIDDLNVFTTSTASRFTALVSGAMNSSSSIKRAEITNFSRVHETLSNAELGNILYGPVSLSNSAPPVGNLWLP